MLNYSNTLTVNFR